MSALRRSLGFLKSYWLITMGAFVSLIVTTAANLVSPQIIRMMLDNGIIAHNMDALFRTALLLVGVALIRGLFTFTQGFWSEKSSQAAAYDIRNALFGKIQNLSFSYHDRAQTGQLMTRITSDVDQLRTFIGMGMLQMVSAIVMLVGSIVFLFSMNWQLALLTLVTVPAIIVVLSFFLRFVRPLFGLVQGYVGELNTVLQENLAGVRVVQAFAREPFERQRYTQANKNLLDANIRTVQAMSLNFPLIFFISSLGTLGVIWFGGHLVINRALTLGELIAFNSYLGLLIMPLMQLGFISAQIARAGVSAGRIFEILDTPSEVMDRPGAQPLAAIQGRVAFENVTFGYFVRPKDDQVGSNGQHAVKEKTGDKHSENGAMPGNGASAQHTLPSAQAAQKGSGHGGHGATNKHESNLILKGVSFTAEPGMTVAIMGKTGSGKSTIINLIPRFYDVSSGRITIDGTDIRDVTLETLRAQIGIVLQDTTLFSGTIRDNIAYGHPDAHDEAIYAAAQAAQAHDFILAMPNGYETLIGERGVTLSGGQRQRVAIARAILRDPRILILDDSTSSVDAETEFLIQQALDKLMMGRTSFVIAQRISTVRSAGLILLLDNGRIAAMGTHEELLATSALYGEIIDSQFGGDFHPELELAMSEE